MNLSLLLADKAGIQWAQEQVIRSHYLHKPVDVRCSLLVYLVMLHEERVGCLIFGRPEATRVTSWYGSVQDVEAGRCPLTRWQILNLARVWLSPAIQQGGPCYIPNAATYVIGQALRRVGYDYLLAHPPCFLDEPWEIVDCLSYCDVRYHRGTIYRAANFRLLRQNGWGIQTWARPLPRLTRVQRREIESRATHAPRSKRYRSMRAVAAIQQLSLEVDG